MNRNLFFVLTAGIVILALMSAGCSGITYSSNNPEIPVGTATESSTPAATETPEPTVEPVSEPTESHWYDDMPDYNPAVIDADDNLFGVEIEGIKYDEYDNWYTMHDEDRNMIFLQEVYHNHNLDLYHNLDEFQYNELIDKYGEPKEVIFEKYDSTGDGELDKVAVRYEGSKDSFTYEQEYPGRLAVYWFIERFIKDDWDDLKPLFQEAGQI